MKINEIKICRHKDDILFLSQSTETKPDFYPNNLELVRSNSNIYNVNFPDLNIRLNEPNCITIDLYDKRNDFNFKIN